MQNKISPRAPAVCNIFITQEDIRITDIPGENHIIRIDIIEGGNTSITTGNQSISKLFYITSNGITTGREIILCSKEEYDNFMINFTGGTQVLNLRDVETMVNTSFEIPSKYNNENSLYFIVWNVNNNIAASTPIPYIPSKQIKIENNTAGSSIYYTTNGNDPNNTDNLYSSQFEVLKGTTIKAKAFKEGMRSSNVATLIVN